MDKLPKIGRYPFTAEPFHCDFSGKLFMGHLGNHLLNAADFHSNDRGYGMNYLNTVRKTWVLSRLAIEMEEMPKAYEKFFVETWVEGAMRYFTSRNYKVVGEDGHVYGHGRSIWAMIDTETRQPTDILAVRDGLITEYIEKDYLCPIEKSSRVRMDDKVVLVRSIDTFYNDVDMNGHINSVKYIEHLLDLWDLEWYRRHALRRLDIAYVAESHQGNQLNFYRTSQCETVGEETETLEYCVKITKTVSPELEEIEVCRCKVVFGESVR